MKALKTWVINTWAWFKSFFNEEVGASTTRALNWMWMATLCFNLTFTVVHTAIKTGDAKLPPIEATSGYVALTGLLLAAKVGQRVYGENPVTGTGTGDPVPPSQDSSTPPSA